jgi:hypothetical protein
MNGSEALFLPIIFIAVSGILLFIIINIAKNSENSDVNSKKINMTKLRN